MDDNIDLEQMENLMNSTDEPITPDSMPEPRASGVVMPTSSGLSLKEKALAGLPAEWRERLIADAGLAGVRHDNDVGWLLVGSVLDSAASALAAGASAEALRRELERLPAAMLDGAKLAGGDVAGEIKLAARDVGGAILQAGNLAAGGMAKDLIHVKKVINDAAVIGADKIKSASDDLVGKLDAAVDQKVSEGVDVFAKAAAQAAVATSKAAAASRFAWSAAGVAFMMIFFSCVGGFIDHEYLSLTHRIAPAPFVLTATGKINCGKDPSLGTGEICEIR